MTIITCSDPSHASRSGEAGWTDELGITDLDVSPPGYLCPACVAHVPPVEPEPVTVPPTDAEIEAARLSLAAATTVSQTKTRALALDDLRARQLAAIHT